MSTNLSFGDHRSFHTEVLRGAIGGGVGGLLVGALIMFTSVATTGDLALLAPLTLATVAAALGFSGTSLSQRVGRCLLSAVVSVIPVLLLIYLLKLYPGPAWILGGLGIGVVATLHDGPGIRRLVGIGLGLPALLLAAFAGYRLGLFGMVKLAAPAPLATMVGGAVAGFVASAAFGLRRIEVVTDPVTRAFKRAEQILRGDLLRLVTQAKRVYDEILRDLHTRQLQKATEYEIRDRSRDLCLSLIETALRWHAIQGETALKNRGELTGRIADLHTAAAEAGDHIARDQYDRAARSLEDQIKYIDSIDRGRERTRARIVAQTALLEKVRFSLVNYHAHDSERLTSELRTVGNELEALTSDVDIIGEALREAEIDSRGELEAGDEFASSPLASSRTSSSE